MLYNIYFILGRCHQSIRIRAVIENRESKSYIVHIVDDETKEQNNNTNFTDNNMGRAPVT